MGTRGEYNVENIMILLCVTQKIKQFSGIWHPIKARKMFKLFHFLHIRVNNICKLHSASDKQLMMRIS